MSMTVLEAAFQVAFDAHKGEFRRGPKGHRRTVPYFIHTNDVVKRMTNWGIYCTITLGIGITQDVDESHPDENFLSRLEKLCTEDEDATTVKAIIKGVEEELTYIPKSQWTDNFPKKKWESKEKYLASFMKASMPSLAVKVSDHICNVWDFVHVGSKSAKRYFQAAEGLFDAMTLRKDELIKYFDEQPIEAMFMDHQYLHKGITA